MRGKWRSEIINDCPEEFKPTLNSWIDKIESCVNDITSNLTVTSVDDLSSIADAMCDAEKLGDNIY